MPRSDPSRTVLLALGLFLVVLGISVLLPVAVAGATIDHPTAGRAEISQLTHNQAVARPGQPVQPAPRGLVAVLPASAVVPTGFAHRPKVDALHDESHAAGRSLDVFGACTSGLRRLSCIHPAAVLRRLASLESRTL